jgi:hypothetical protein
VNRINRILFVLALATVAMAQTPESPLSDARLSVHTLVREDIFAGFLGDDMESFARGEKNIDLLMEKRPAAKANLLAWKGGAALYRAVRAHENNRADEFKKHYQMALDFFSQARSITPQGDGVAAVTGGSYVIFADRLPKEYRAAAWSEAYNHYQALWKQQGSIVDKLPVHLRGELLGGLAQSAERTGRTEELAQYIEKMLTVLRDTPYEPVARRWKENPKAASSASLTCLTCHDAGRLNVRLGALGSNK